MRFYPNRVVSGHLDYRAANVAFLDGHAEAMNYKELGYEVDPVTKRPVEKALTDLGGPGNNRLWTGTGRDEPPI
ncbi:MAG: hypothetical protein H8E73_02780 [Planctomycetes bacterium]|nr:hypothetical protein [Planctomycetota bacterium]MBL7186431.1 hypothetical protein [Phycisphaerae bacterium]